MSLPLEERDNIIVTNDSLELMKELGKQISDKFSRVWILIYKYNARKRYGIEVANVWGGKLENSVLGPVEEFIEKFMIDRKVDFVEDDG